MVYQHINSNYDLNSLTFCFQFTVSLWIFFTGLS